MTAKGSTPWLSRMAGKEVASCERSASILSDVSSWVGGAPSAITRLPAVPVCLLLAKMSFPTNAANI